MNDDITNMKHKKQCLLPPVFGPLRICQRARECLSVDDVCGALSKHFGVDDTGDNTPADDERDLRDIGSIASKHTGANGSEFYLFSDPGSTVNVIVFEDRRSSR